jgi:hypothetical protein
LIPSTYSGQALRGIKTVELRSRSTRIVGERFYIYASKGSGVRVQGSGKYKACSDDLRVAAPPPPLWMIELAEQVKMIRVYPVPLAQKKQVLSLEIEMKTRSLK